MQVEKCVSEIFSGVQMQMGEYGRLHVLCAFSTCLFFFFNTNRIVQKCQHKSYFTTLPVVFQAIYQNRFTVILQTKCNIVCVFVFMFMHVAEKKVIEKRLNFFSWKKANWISPNGWVYSIEYIEELAIFFRLLLVCGFSICRVQNKLLKYFC